MTKLIHAQNKLSKRNTNKYNTEKAPKRSCLLFKDRGLDPKPLETLGSFPGLFPLSERIGSGILTSVQTLAHGPSFLVFFNQPDPTGSPVLW